MRTVIAMVGLSVCGCYATPVDPDPTSVPLGRIPADRVEKVRRILESDPVEIMIPRTLVRSRLDVYEFLLKELPFTASVVRVLGKAEYDIHREEPKPGEGAEARERRERTYYLDDRKGMQLAAEQVYLEPGKWIYYIWGKYEFSLVLNFPIKGSAVVVVTAHWIDEVLETEARVYVPITKALGGLVEKIVRQKSSIFIDAATTVAEAAADDPGGLIRKCRGSTEVDQEILKIFEERFLKP